MARKFKPKAEKQLLSVTKLTQEVQRLDPFTPPEGWKVSCEKFEKEGKVTLSEEAQNHLWSTIAFYVRDAFEKSLTPEAAERLKTVKDLEKTLVKLEVIIQKLSSENPYSTIPLILSNYEGDKDILGLLHPVILELQGACQTTIGEFDQHIVTASPERRPGFACFISRLMTIFHFSGGNVSTAWSPNAIDPKSKRAKRWTPFVRFSFDVYQSAHTLAPNTLRPIQDATFGEALNSIHKKIKKDPLCLGPDEFLQLIARNLEMPQ